MDAPDLDPPAVAAAVRSLLAKETGRVDDPRFIPEDRAGWHATRDPAEDEPGAPYYDPEAWRWFELVDAGYVDGMVLVVFRWTDPSTPDLRYSWLGHVDGLPTPESAATVLRGHLRSLFEPGWRDRVDRHWLSRTQVLVSRPADGEGLGGRPDLGEGYRAYRMRAAQRLVAERAALWDAPRIRDA